MPRAVLDLFDEWVPSHSYLGIRAETSLPLVKSASFGDDIIRRRTNDVRNCGDSPTGSSMSRGKKFDSILSQTDCSRNLPDRRNSPLTIRAARPFTPPSVRDNPQARKPSRRWDLPVCLKQAQRHGVLSAIITKHLFVMHNWGTILFSVLHCIGSGNAGDSRWVIEGRRVAVVKY